MRGLKELPRSVEKALRGEFRAIGQLVADEGRLKFTGGVARSPGVAKAAAGFRPVVRLGGVEVEQRLRKTTGKRGDWGVIQMRKGLIPALYDKEKEIVALLDTAIERVNQQVGL